MRVLAVLLLAAAASTGAGCGGAGPASKLPISKDLLRTQRWSVQTIGTGTHPQAAMEVDFDPDGTIVGKAGCNSFRGTYAVDDGRLTFGPLTMSRIGCEPVVMAQERAFSEALAASRTGVLQFDQLRLRDGAGATTLVMLRR